MRTIRPGKVPPVRRGSTLTEVLVALMIMSIGLVSLATLFPLATLRAAKAVQVTAATDLRYNADALLTMYPQMILDPDLDPLSDNLPGFNQPSLNWVIDPIGYEAALGRDEQGNIRLDPNKTAYADFYGQEVNLASKWVPRYPFNRGLTRSLAEDFGGMSDTVEIKYEKTVTGAIGGATELTLPADALGSLKIDLDNLNRPSLPLRLTLFSADGRTSVSRNLTQVIPSNNLVKWTEDLNGNGQLDTGEDANLNQGLDQHPLPANFVVTSIRLEQPQLRYSWLLTVRRVISGLAEVDVVVFFRRGLSSDPNASQSDERLYPVVTMGTVGGKQQVVGFSQGSPVIEVQYDTFRPAIKKGGFLFDAGNARWYRITNILSDNGSRVSLLIDPPAIISSPRDNNGNVAGNLVMFPKGVVEVFSLGTRP
jgi:prepilin-type N-terminal cleavage/methylation domain-containing protein